jgi:acyl-CoA thioester hydrolase
MGVVHHSNYPVWMEVGRTDYLARLGYSYSGLETAGILFPLVAVNFRLHRPSYYEQRLRVVTSLLRLQSRKLEFGYRVMRAKDLLVEGRTVHVCADRDLRVRKIPAELFRTLRQSMDGEG